jgi:glycosyltransferase involved in cell wall biosynthesis
MINIAVVMDITSKSGGQFHMAVSICNYLKKIKNFNFIYITTTISAKKSLDKELNINTVLYNKSNVLIRLLNKLINTFSFIKIKHPFNKLLNKNRVDLIYFLNSSRLINNFNNIKYIYTVFDLEHRYLQHLPEFKKNISLQRDRDCTLASIDSKKIIAPTYSMSKQFIKLYNTDPKKITHIKFPPPITSVKINNIKRCNNEIIEYSKNKNYFLYPAQFWSHKNHEYLINAVKNIKKKEKLNFKIVFTGADKGNMGHIKKLIFINDLCNNFKILDYVTDLELCLLYKNCRGVVIPTLVAPHTFPLYEAFFFKKPVIYNKHVLSNELKSKVIGLDVTDINDFNKKIKLLNNSKIIKKMIKNNHQYFLNEFKPKKIIDKLQKIFLESSKDISKNN